MTALSGPTQQALARLLDAEVTHSVIDSLFQRFQVDPLPTADGIPTKLKKATHLTRELAKRPEERLSLMKLIEYVGSDSSGMPRTFRRGDPAATDLYENLDHDLEAAPPGQQPVARSPKPERQFKRPGTTAPMPTEATTRLPKRAVFVVRGRDSNAYEALESLLLALDLRIVTWDDAVRACGGGTPHTLDVVRAGINLATAVVVLMTADDLGQVKPDFYQATDDPREANLSGQARQNVVFEAGWAMALDQDHVVLVRVGDVRPLSDIDGLNYVSLSGDLSSRRQLIGRLRNCELAVDDSGERWRTAGTFPGQE
ncbi:hypothetical protein ASF48_07715 [Rathayibacter sp. Leaf299]|uniref:TIR domain-containing protein n=1 Tax=Rathayibacter sp. Leaf299 TaxID=1736328 RepID=UPI00070091A4|nr:TIR domain-containing protein [Rathayibacter sp. Leaf299]KQQ20517.1 hypothetical protein ASF48_07715 [Rathayibacter sp. Leaf299]